MKWYCFTSEKFFISTCVCSQGTNTSSTRPRPPPPAWWSTSARTSAATAQPPTTATRTTSPAPRGQKSSRRDAPTTAPGSSSERQRGRRQCDDCNIPSWSDWSRAEHTLWALEVWGTLRRRLRVLWCPVDEHFIRWREKTQCWMLHSCPMGKTGDINFLVEDTVEFSHQMKCTACEFNVWRWNWRKYDFWTVGNNVNQFLIVVLKIPW